MLSNKALLTCLFLHWLLLSSSHAASVREQYIYYPVIAVSVKSLVQKVDTASPIRYEGKVFHGYTDSKVSWQFYWETKQEGCYLTKIISAANITITLPELDKSRASPAVIAIWDQWYPALYNHEQNHKKHAVAIAEEIEKSLQKLGPSRTCKRLEEKANRIGYELIEKLNKMDRAYDRKTKNGELEGARLSTYIN